MNLIVAVTNDYAIGKGNDLLFHLPKDLQYFKEKTINKIVVIIGDAPSPKDATSGAKE